MYDNHGTMKTYRKGCACNLCRAVNAAYQKDYQARRKEKIKLLESENEKPKTDKATASINP